MTTISVSYQGDLTTEATHTQSGTSLLTDAPIENHGAEGSFSPSDLIATAVLTSMISLIGSTARSHNLSPGNISGEISHSTAGNSKKISSLDMEIRMQGHYLNDMEKKLLESSALSCPVARSIHPDIQLIVKFSYE